MALERVSSEQQLLGALSTEREVLVGFFGEFSQASQRAQPAFEKYCAEHDDRDAYLVDVGAVSGLHQRFGVTQVPTVLRLRGETVLTKLLGPQTAEGYGALLDGGGSAPRAGTEGPRHQVRVYVTDTCPWCTRVKSYLRQHRVPFTEINVSRDESAAREMVRRSGQQGVPQVDIDGRMIVGFDKKSIDNMLGLEGR